MSDNQNDDVKTEKVSEVNSDTMESAQKTETAKKESHKYGYKDKLKSLWNKYLAKKKLTLPLTGVILLILILAVPFSRYATLGLFIKRQFNVKVTDASTGNPVTSADVTLGGATARTDNQGKATIKSKIGSHKLEVSKKYYSEFSKNTLVPFSQHGNYEVRLTATGRQVPITVTDKISGQALADAEIKALDTDGKTDKDGKLLLVLPADRAKLEATISAKGYNDQKVSITITDKPIDANKFNIVPAGKLYFLSKLSGKIDVVKTNLDGTDRQTVLAGTGKEEEGGTVLLASRDWKYLVLKSRRDSDLAKLYLIETATDKATTIDEGKADFSLIGWVGQNFTYQVNRTSISAWQPKSTALKAFNAGTKTLTTLDETDASGDQFNYAQESISWVHIVGGNELVFFKTWIAHHANYSVLFPEMSGRQARIIGILVGPNSKKTIKTYDISPNSPYGTTYYNPISSYNNVVYEPNEIFYSLDVASDTSYSKLQDDKVQENNDEAKQFFVQGKTYPTYLLSPSGNNTFWSEQRDGKNTLFIGDASGSNGKQIAALSEFSIYGWYTDNYLLVSKKGSELYIMGRQGGTPLKITDYHKPDFSYFGYGGGYGGI